MLHKWWFWVILVILLLVIAYFVWYFIEKRRAEKEGRVMTPLGSRARTAAAGVAAAGVIGGGAAANGDPIAEDANPQATATYRTENDTATVNSQASSLKEQATNNGETIKGNKVGGSREARSEAGRIYANKNSKVYHLPGQQVYKIKNADNWVVFNSEAEAIAAGYHAAKK